MSNSAHSLANAQALRLLLTPCIQYDTALQGEDKGPPAIPLRERSHAPGRTIPLAGSVLAILGVRPSLHYIVHFRDTRITQPSKWPGQVMVKHARRGYKAERECLEWLAS